MGAAVPSTSQPQCQVTVRRDTGAQRQPMHKWELSQRYGTSCAQPLPFQMSLELGLS